MKDPMNTVFVLVSESCVPIKPFSSLLSHLDRTGWQGQMETQLPEEFAIKDPIKAKRLDKVKDVPPGLWRFHPQWIVLNREMSQLVLDTDLTGQWANSFAPDESLIGTQLVLMGYPLAERTLPIGCTWTRWDGPHTGHPDNFCEVDGQLLGQLLAAPHFFARKFMAESNIRECGLHLHGTVKLPLPKVLDASLSSGPGDDV
jgi:hypothetical protein